MLCCMREKGDARGSKIRLAALAEFSTPRATPPLEAKKIAQITWRSSATGTKGSCATSIWRCFYRPMVHDEHSSASGALDRCGPIHDSDLVCRGIVDNACLRSELSVFDRAFARRRYTSCFSPSIRMGRRVSSFINGAHFLHGVVNLHARVFGSGIVEHDVTTRARSDACAMRRSISVRMISTMKPLMSRTVVEMVCVSSFVVVYRRNSR